MRFIIFTLAVMAIGCGKSDDISINPVTPPIKPPSVALDFFKEFEGSEFVMDSVVVEPVFFDPTGGDGTSGIDRDTLLCAPYHVAPPTLMGKRCKLEFTGYTGHYNFIVEDSEAFYTPSESDLSGDTLHISRLDYYTHPENGVQNHQVSGELNGRQVLFHPNVAFNYVGMNINDKGRGWLSTFVHSRKNELGQTAGYIILFGFTKA